MTIERVEINDYLVFKNELEIDFSPGINVLLGANGTGKTTLMKAIYGIVGDAERRLAFTESHAKGNDAPIKRGWSHGSRAGYQRWSHNNVCVIFKISDDYQSVYIPEKDILEHARGLLPFIDQKQTGFGFIYRDTLISGQDVYTREQTEMQTYIVDKITNIIDGYIEWNPADGIYYTIKTDGSRIPFAHEASAYKKLGYLGLLVSCGRFEPGTILFWDEPENSLNPEIVPVLVDILLRLAQNGVQIFIASHDYNLVRYFDIREAKDIPVLFHYLSKDENNQIQCNSSPEYIKLPNNHIEKAEEDLYEAVIADAMGVQRNGKVS
ncbi:MAG: AAA family ATPase [Defluviitaleaceae bacterium]|nr:AAA family ATPase [Defluviitaleaceae bacterium]